MDSVIEGLGWSSSISPSIGVTYETSSSSEKGVAIRMLVSEGRLVTGRSNKGGDSIPNRWSIESTGGVGDRVSLCSACIAERRGEETTFRRALRESRPCSGSALGGLLISDTDMEKCGCERCRRNGGGVRASVAAGVSARRGRTAAV